MQISGIIDRIYPIEEGNTVRGSWRKKVFVIKTAEEFPKCICFTIWGARIDQFNIEQGRRYNIYFDISSREHNERWYTEARAWKIEQLDADIQTLPNFTSTHLDEAEDDVLPF